MFLLGEETGIKADPTNVSLAMRKARDVDGSTLFGSSDYLTPRQISSFFSRLAKKKTLSAAKAPHTLLEEEEDDDDTEVEQIEKEIEDLAGEVMELNITAITSRRKQPYVDLLNSLVEQCSCQKKA